MPRRGKERARVVVLERAEPLLELGTVGALLESAAPEGAIVVASLAGDAAALGRYQQTGRSGHAREVRRHTGGRAAFYGDGVLSLSAVIPSARAWLDDDEDLAGPRLLNRYVRGLLSWLRSCGLSAAYPGRDFVTAAGRRVAYVTLERASSGALLFQAVLGTTRSYLARDPDPHFPGLPSPPEPTWLEREGGDPALLRALAESYARHYSVEPSEAAAPEPVGAPALELALPPHSGDIVPIPIGELQAHVELAADGTISHARLTGDWIASSVEVLMLEELLAGRPPEPDLLARLVDRWLGLPGNLTIGLVDATPLVDAIRSAAARAKSGGRH